MSLLPRKRAAEAIFKEFSSFLEKSGILSEERGNKTQHDYELLCRLFEQKIRRCEVGVIAILPSQVNQMLALFESLSEKISKSLEKKGNYLKFKESIVKSAFLDFKSSWTEISPVETLINSAYSAFCSYSSRNGYDVEVSLEEGVKILENAISKHSFSSSMELSTALLSVFCNIYNELVINGEVSKNRFFSEAVERFGEIGLISDLFNWDVLTNLSHICLDFLERNEYVRYKRGKAVNTENSLDKGLKQFQAQMTAIINDFPLAIKADLLAHLKSVVKKGARAFRENALNKMVSIEEIISGIVQDVFDELENEWIEKRLELPKKQDKEVMRTYKVGLRVPEILLEAQNELIRVREVLQFLRKKHQKSLGKNVKARGFAGFTRYKCLERARPEVKEAYKKTYEKYKECSLHEIYNKLGSNKQELKLLAYQDEVLNSKCFKKSDLPRFLDASKPAPDQISVHDYQYLASKSFKLTCKYLNAAAEKFIEQIPPNTEALINQAHARAQANGKKITRGSLASHPEMAVANLLGRYGNIDQVAFFQMASAIEATNTAKLKVEFVKKLLFSGSKSLADFSEAGPVLLGYYSVPYRLVKYLARAWKVEPSWVRNILVGWRRRIDPLMPFPFQVENLTGLFEKLAKFCLKYSSNELERNTIKILQKRHALHLFSSVDLSPLLPKRLREDFFRLKTKIPPFPSQLKRLIKARAFNFSQLAVQQATEEKLTQVNSDVKELEVSSQSYKNCQGFANKLELIRKITKLPELKFAFENFLPGNRFTSSLGKLILHTDFGKKSKIKRIFTALRGVGALAFVRMIPEAIARLESAFTPDNCVTAPFKSSKRKKQYLPATLLSPKYVVERKSHPSERTFLNNKKATVILRKGEPIWLGIPIYSPDQEEQFVELLEGKRNSVRRKGLFWFQLLPSRKIVQCLKKGAVVKSLRLNVPRGPTNKIVADVSLVSREPQAFERSGNFLKAWDRTYGTMFFPKHDVLGSDFNRIGINLVAVSNPDLEIDLTAGPNMMKMYEKSHLKLEKYRRMEISHLQGILDSKSRDKRVLGRIKAQITLLHRRRQNIMTEMKRQALMIYAYAGYRTNVKYFGWDGAQGIPTRGKRGTLAMAITYMPNRKALFNEFNTLLEDLQAQGFLPHYESVKLVTPYTSQICGGCFQDTGKTKKTLVQGAFYDEMVCSRCGWNGNRHTNAARVCALLVQKLIHVHTLVPVSAIDGL